MQVVLSSWQLRTQMHHIFEDLHSSQAFVEGLCRLCHTYRHCLQPAAGVSCSFPEIFDVSNSICLRTAETITTADHAVSDQLSFSARGRAMYTYSNLDSIIW